MKNFIDRFGLPIILLVLGFTLCWILDVSNAKVKASSPERIEVLYVQILSSKTGVVVLHDKDSGMEENCVIIQEEHFTGSSKPVGVSCIPTGRNWK